MTKEERQAKLDEELSEIKVNALSEEQIKEKQIQAREETKKFWQAQVESTAEQRNKEKEAQQVLKQRVAV